MPSMEFFWGVEVKPGQTVSCDPEKGCILRVSQAALGETKKGTHNIVVSAEIDDQKVILGTLSAENRPQFPCDLIFHKEFELSHSSKTASVFVCGYRAVMPDQPEYGSSKDEGAVKIVNNQVINPIAGEVKTVNNQVTNPIAGEVKTVNNQVINSIADNLDSDEDDSDSSSLDDLTSSGDDLTEDESDSEDDSSTEEDDTSTEEDDSSSEEIDTSSEEIATSSEEDSSDEDGKNTPVKPEDGKKRVAEFALKTLASDKKAKIATPSGQATTGDKELPHVATPHPSKQASKTSGNSKSKAKSTKSVGTHACKSCSKAFGSDSALQSHEKAKHT